MCANVSRWHADIKPSNILNVAESYKLADPGFAKFLIKNWFKPNTLPKTHLDGGTWTYGTFLYYLACTGV